MVHTVRCLDDDRQVRLLAILRIEIEAHHRLVHTIECHLREVEARLVAGLHIVVLGELGIGNGVGRPNDTATIVVGRGLAADHPGRRVAALSVLLVALRPCEVVLYNSTLEGLLVGLVDGLSYHDGAGSLQCAIATIGTGEGCHLEEAL